MNHRVSRGGPHGLVASLFRSASLGVVSAGLLLPGCGNDELRHVPETITISQGKPTADQTAGTVEHLGPVNPGSYSETNPFQVDTFEQNAVAKVDVLWMIDNSGSMAPKQAKVQADFASFIAELTTGPFDVDYQIGVVTTDTYNPAQSGRLQNPDNLSSPWLSTQTCPAATCDLDNEFKTMANVGTTGSGDEKGLLAAAEAVSSPLTDPGGPNAGFVRPDASLAIILVSDEEDSSCSPGAFNTEGCNTSPVVDCSSDSGAPYCTQCLDLTTQPYCDQNLSYGNVEYWSRFFLGLKGFGEQQLVTLSAFVGDTDSVTIAESGLGLSAGLKGCLVTGADPSQAFSYAVYSPRYMAVATAVSGAQAVHSICDEDFTSAVQDIALYAALQSTFYLTRLPSSVAKIQVFVNGTMEAPGAMTWSYDSSRNAVIFTAVPAAGSTIVISYPVAS